MKRFYLLLSLLLVGLIGSAADRVSVTVEEAGKKPRTVTVDLPPAENVDVEVHVPNAPTDLKGEQVGTTAKVHLWWADNSTDENRFWIERDDGSGQADAHYGEVGADVREFDDTAAVAGKSYMYRVTAVKDGVGTSTFSNTVQVSVLPPPVQEAPSSPADFTGAGEQSGQVTLSWTDTPNEKTYALEANSGSGWQQRASLPADTASYVDGPYAAGSTVQFRIRAINDQGQSEWGTTEVKLPTVDKTKYAEMGGIPGSHATLTSQTDLSDPDGTYVLKPGAYTLSKMTFKNGVKFYAETPGSVSISIPAGKQVKGGTNVWLAGITFAGGGLGKDTDGTHAAVVTDNGWRMHTVRVTKAVGVGILAKGTGLVSWHLEADSNGTSGRMIRSRGVNQKPGSGYTEIYAHLHGNNHGGKTSDAANKGTQTSEYYSLGLEINDEMDGGQWFDISCWNVVMDHPYIHDIKATKDWFKAMGVRWELNNHGTYPSGVYAGRIENVDGAAFSIDESSNIEVLDTTVGKCKYWAEIRQLTRDDDPGDGGLTGPWPKGPNNRQGPGRPGGAKLGWVTYNVNLSRNHILSGAGPAVLSGAGTSSKLRQGADKLTFKDNTFDGSSESSMVKIPK